MAWRSKPRAGARPASGSSRPTSSDAASAMAWAAERRPDATPLEDDHPPLEDDPAGVRDDEADGQRCLDAALRFLAQRPRAEREVRRRLGEKGFAPEAIDRAVIRLSELKLLDDRAFADYWMENRALFRPRGARALRSELLQKGVERTVVDEALAGERDEVDDAYRAGARAAARLSVGDERLFRQRLGGFLTRRGFGWEAIEPAVDRLWVERAASS